MFQTRLFWLSVIYVGEVEKINDKLKCRGQSLDPPIYPTHINVTNICLHSLHLKTIDKKKSHQDVVQDESGQRWL